MANTIRLMPALIAISAGSLALKAVEVADAATEAYEPEAQDESHDDDYSSEYDPEIEDDLDFDSELTDVEYSDVEEEDSNCTAVPDFTAETGLSQYEIEVLRSLADRRKELDERAAELDTREQMAAAAESRLDDQITELKELEAGVQGLLASMDQKRDERLEGLVKVYQAMKPKDAARIFEALDDDVLLEVSQRMKHAQLGAVMSAMSSARAEHLTRLLAERAELPATADEILDNAEAG